MKKGPLGNENECEGRHYGFTFDLNPTAMKKDGVLPNEVYDSTKVALAVCGFVDHPEGSVYITRTPLELDPDEVIQMLQATLPDIAPEFGTYVWRAHLFEGWTDMTPLLKKERPGSMSQVPNGVSSNPYTGRRRKGVKAALRRRLGRWM